MAIIYNKTSRSAPHTNVAGWGKIGTGPYSLSYGSSYANNNFYSNNFYYSLGGMNDLGAHYSNFAVNGNIGFAVGKKLNSYSSPISTYDYVELRINKLNISNSVLPPWIITSWDGTQYPEMTRLALIDNSLMCAGNNHILVQYGNTLIGFGENTYGQCNVPSNGMTGARQICAGFGHSLLLYTNGSITGWGLTLQDQLNIPAGITAEQIASGQYHNIALKSDGSVVCWGGNSYGQCDVPAGLTGITYINAGFYHSLAIRNNGSVVCWGLSASGQCTVPASIGTGGLQIAGGSGHTALLKKDGSVICWGDNTYLQGSIPKHPDQTEGRYEAAISGNHSPPLGITGSATKIGCSENATFVLYTGKSDIGKVNWANYSEAIAAGVTGLLAPVRAENIYGPTSSTALTGKSMYIRPEGYDPIRHDIYTYPSTPVYPNSVMPNGINTAWWLSGSTTERKLNRCFISTYQPDGIFKSYDWFSPPDLSGCSIRPRRFGASWIGGSELDVESPGWGHLRLNETQNLWNYFNSGFWTNVLITKKHAIASKHYSGPNINLNNVQWIRRDGVIISRNLTKISNLNFAGYNPDMVLYELDSELTTDDLENISVYNILPKLNGMTGSKLIDTRSYLYKGITTAVNYSDPFFMSQVGRRIWYLDGQDRVYSKRILKIAEATEPSWFISHLFVTTTPCPSNYEPDDVDAFIYSGDSGTPVFITAAAQMGYTEPKETTYFTGQGTTWGRTLFLGLFDAGAGQWGSTFVNNLNSFLQTRGITGSDLLQQIDIDSVGPGLPWTAPVGGPVSFDPRYSIPDYINSFEINGWVANTQDSNSLVGQGTVSSWDSNNKILTISGLSGSFDVSGLTAYILINGNCTSVLYSQINNYIIPINNGLGTTAGSNDILENEAAGYTFDSNNPFGDE